MVQNLFLWHNSPMFDSIWNRPFVLICSAVAIGLLTVIYFLQPRPDIENIPPDLVDILNTNFEKVSNITLIDHNNDAFTSGNLSGKWSFIVFGYTNCPDVCPTTLLEIDDLALLLTDPSNKSEKIQYIFVSVDPTRDTTAELASYLAYFEAGYIGVTGSEIALRKFTEQVGIKFSYTELPQKKYAVNHSSHMVLIDPFGRYVARFPAPQYASDIRDWFTKIKKLAL